MDYIQLNRQNNYVDPYWYLEILYPTTRYGQILMFYLCTTETFNQGGKLTSKLTLDDLFLFYI